MTVLVADRAYTKGAPEAVLRATFSGARAALETVRGAGLRDARELSMGMSHDFEVAVEEVELATLGWVHWHNTQRLHGYLDDLPPVEFEQLYADQITAQAPDPGDHRSPSRLAQPQNASQAVNRRPSRSGSPRRKPSWRVVTQRLARAIVALARPP